MKNQLFIRFLTYVLTIVAFFPVETFAQKTKLACVGNSITYGYGLSNPSTESYPAQVQQLLETTNWNVGNYGDNSRTMIKGSGYSYWDSWAYNSALSFNPDVVIIGLGTNDAKKWLWDWLGGSDFKKDYKAMVQSFKNLSTKPDIWIYLIIPGEKPDWNIYNSYIKDKVNPVIKEVAIEEGLGLIDLYTVFDGQFGGSWYQTDSVHPTAQGSGIIAQKLEEMLLMAKPTISTSNGKVIAPDGFGYQWYIDGIPVPSGNEGTLKEMTITQSGNYKVSIKINGDNETRIVSQEFIVSAVSAINQPYLSANITISPNPTSGSFSIVSDAAIDQVIVTDYLGNTVKTCSEISVDLSRQPAGLYFATLISGDSRVVKKVVKDY